MSDISRIQRPSAAADRDRQKNVVLEVMCASLLVTCFCFKPSPRRHMIIAMPSSALPPNLVSGITEQQNMVSRRFRWTPHLVQTKARVLTTGIGHSPDTCGPFQRLDRWLLVDRETIALSGGIVLQTHDVGGLSSASHPVNRGPRIG